MVRALAGMAIVLALSSPLPAGDLPPAIALQYQQAVDGFQRMYSHLTISGSLKREYPQRKQTISQTFSYRAAGPKFRLDVTTVVDREFGRPVESGENYIATPEGSLYSYRRPGSDRFDDAKEWSYQQVRAKIDNICAILSPFKFAGEGTILDHLRQPNVRIDKVEDLVRDGRKLVKITYEDRFVRKGHRDLPSWYLLSPGEGWAVREFSRTSNDAGHVTINRGQLEYSDMVGGVPLVSRIETWREKGPSHTLVRHEVVEINRVINRDPDEWYFTGFAF